MRKKEKYSRFAIYYVVSALASLIILLIGFSYMIATYLPEEGEESAPKPKYGEANGLREVATKGKSSITPVLATDFAVGGDWVESATETFAGVATIGGSTFTGGVSVSAPSRGPSGNESLDFKVLRSLA